MTKIHSEQDCLRCGDKQMIECAALKIQEGQHGCVYDQIIARQTALAKNVGDPTSVTGIHPTAN